MLKQQEIQTGQIIMISLQLTFFIIAGALCIWKVISSFKTQIIFIKYFYLLVLTYIILQIGLQAYSLSEYLTDSFSSSQLSIYVGINIYCMIFDSYIIALLSICWSKIQRDFHSQILQNLDQNQNILRHLIAIVIWMIIYSAYFVYFLINPSQKINQILLYGVSQGISIILILLFTIIQIKNGLILLKTLKKYQTVVSFTINQSRFVILFWMSSVFNISRMLFLIAFTIYNYMNISIKQSSIWVQYYIFTFSAIFPISFYLFGFKLRQSQRQQKIETIQQTESPTRIKNNFISEKQKQISKRSSSSYHETQLAQSF